MGRDLLTRPYGRFYYLPKLLAQCGHQVYVMLLSYKREPMIKSDHDNINWMSVSLLPKGPVGYLARAIRLVQDVQPDWLIGFSDTYFGILAQKLGDRYGVNSLIDAYDNYESYIPWLKPLHHVWRNSLSKATLVTAAGPNLAQYLGQSRPGKPTVVVPMAADPTGFVYMDRQQCRMRLGLPGKARLIGYCGAISSTRGIDTLFAAFNQLQKLQPDIQLVLSGRKDKHISLPHNTRWLGYLPDDQMPTVINSLNLLIVINRDSIFGKFSYPVKLYEAMNCKVPVIATETPSTKWILKDFPGLLVKAGDAAQLLDKIIPTIQRDRIDYGSRFDWREISLQFQEALTKHGGSGKKNLGK